VENAVIEQNHSLGRLGSSHLFKKA